MYNLHPTQGSHSVISLFFVFISETSVASILQAVYFEGVVVCFVALWFNIPPGVLSH
jgi:hypothetical protein